MVSVKGTFSHKDSPSCNVPQGSILGADMYSDFTAPVEEVVGQSVNDHYYADDSQLYCHFKAGNTQSELDAVNCIQVAVGRVKTWMNENLLKLNDDKTEVLIIGSKKQLEKVSTQHILIGDTKVVPSDSARNIGAVIDSNMSFVKHIDSICKSAWYHLYNIRQIRNFLSQDATKT